MFELNEEYLLEDVKQYLENNITLLIIGPQMDERTRYVHSNINDKIDCVKIEYIYKEKQFDIIYEKNMIKRKCEPLDLGKYLASLTSYGIEFRNIMIDITSLQVPTIMSILRTMKMEDYCKPAKLFTAYAKPEKYLADNKKKYFFSSNFSEPSPVPGFVARVKEDEILIPFLGFEGARIKNIIGEVQFKEVRPIIGFPSDDPKWQFETMRYCMEAIQEQRAESYIEKCKANSIFEAYYLLEKITKKNIGANYVLAPLGTKPHTVAAILFALQHRKECRTIYDYAIENYDTSCGVHNIVITHISHFL